MMTTTTTTIVEEQVDVRERIMAFPLDSGDMADFGPRLRRENGWSASLARRAIEEYRKFLVLAATSGHTVSPSDVVDQVWHLHLLHTRSYWNDLCASILPRPLHHIPSTGAAGESAKFADWYAKTLASYEREFGHEPPADIWPAPGTRHPRRRNVDVDASWVMPRLAAGRIARVTTAMLLLALLLLLCGGCEDVASVTRAAGAGDEWNPFNLRGPQFLVLYGIATAIAWAIAFGIRSQAKYGDDGELGDGTIRAAHLDLDPYEIAYLNGGPVLAANTAIARLVDRGVLEARNDGTLSRLTAAGVSAIEGDSLERAVFEAVRTPRTPVKNVRERITAALDRVRERLDDHGLLLDAERTSAARWQASLVALSVPAVGVIKLLIGIERRRPVEFLAVAIVATIVIGMLLFARPMRRSRRGEAVLEHLKLKHSPIRYAPATVSGMTNDSMLALGLALYGTAYLADAEHQDLRQALTPRQGSADGWSGSSCGGSSCGGGGSSCGGGGSSCGGGGGCGGGGCGGCGGS